MPQYYFHLHGSGARDTEGQEFPNTEAALEESRAVARELAQDRNTASDERIIVTDADGAVIHEEPLFRR